jgi:catechol 2,3-dioxygenase-like lactoylglutathione lyase family enzyme
VGTVRDDEHPDPIRLAGLDHVQVAAPPGSEDAARRFYGELLGMSELAKPAALQARGGVWFACGAHQLHVGIAQPFAPAAKAHPAIAVQPGDLDRLAQRLAESGCPVQWDDAIPGTRRFYTADPWGNRIELVASA